MTEEERGDLLTDERLIVRNSGEIPEITYHSSLYYLQEDADGPGLELTDHECCGLKEAALERYYEIVIRDITIENFHKSIYRGVRRTLYNWRRCLVFAERQRISCKDFSETVARALLVFLEEGRERSGKGLPEIFINCTFEELQELAEELKIGADELPQNIAQSCTPMVFPAGHLQDEKSD